MAPHKSLSYVVGVAGIVGVVALASYRLVKARASKRQNTGPRKPQVCLLSAADSVPGQGVGSAYLEHLALLRKLGRGDFEVAVNRHATSADVVHLVSIDPLSYLRMRLTARPTLASVHFVPTTLDGGVRLPKPLFSLLKRYVLSLYKAADQLHVVNANTFASLEELGIDPSHASYIPNYVSPDRFFPMSQEERERSRAAHGFGRGDFVVMGSGQVQNRKGVQTFVEVARMLPDVQFVWAGGFSFGPLSDGYDELKKLMDKPPANVRFTGIVSREKVNELLNAADLFFLPSYAEQLPMSILEAASTHTPTLARDLAEYHGVLDDKMVVGSHESDFAAAIERLRDDASYYAAEVEHAVQIAETFSEAHVYAQWRELYLSLANRG